MAREKLKQDLTRAQLRFIQREVAPEIQGLDLVSWQTACRAFAPIHSDQFTRKEWFENNRFRLGAAREVVDFVDRWAKELRKSARLETVSMGAIRIGIIEAVRAEQETQDMRLGKLNVVKLSGFRTLIKWADEPERQDEPTTPTRSGVRGRKRRKGKFEPPEVELVKQTEIIERGLLRVTISVINNFIHPYQNVEIELKLDPKLSVIATRPFSWFPLEQKIVIGFLEASLDADPNETELFLDLMANENSESYSISGKIIYDDCDKGRTTESKLRKQKIKL
ncbi:MAG: hypothetical protein RTU92_06980 [Candidatus Thorarchaeota archaeon]